MFKPFARRRNLLLAALAISASAFTLSACNDDGNDTTGDIDITVEPATLTINQGSSAAAAVTIDRSGTFAGSVGLAATGQPTNVAVSFAPTSLGAGESNAAVTVEVGPAAVPGTYTLTLSASGSGVSTDTATLTLVVNAVPAGARQ